MNQNPNGRRFQGGKVRPIRQEYAGVFTALGVLLLLTALLIVCAALHLNAGNEKTPTPPSQSLSSGNASSETPADKPSDSSSDQTPPAGTVQYLTLSESSLLEGDLILVNRDHFYDASLAQGTVTNVREGRLTDIQENVYHLPIGEKLLSALEAMQTGMKTAMNDSVRLLVNAAYRTADDQQAIIDSYTESRGEDYVQAYVAPVGGSEHHTALAADISFYDVEAHKTYATTANDVSAHYSWLLLNCQNYGLILRYTAEKTAITGYSAESWHFRYVGVPHAVYINAHKLALEEYLEQLKATSFSNRLYITTESGECYGVYYVKAGQTTSQVPVPKTQPYTLSGDNAGGYIVTVTETAVPEGGMTELPAVADSSSSVG